jgi:hypothetical protein
VTENERARFKKFEDMRKAGASGVVTFMYQCDTMITTFPFLCPCSTHLKASAVCSKE